MGKRSHGPRPLHQLKRPLYHRGIDHPRTEANDGLTLALRLFKSRHHFERFLDLRRSRLERFMDDANLPGMYASHSLKAHRPRRYSPSAQSFHVSDIAENRIDG